MCMFCSAVLLHCGFFLFVFLTYLEAMLYYLFCYMSSKVISHTDNPFSSNIVLDSPMIDIHVL